MIRNVIWKLVLVWIFAGLLTGSARTLLWTKAIAYDGNVVTLIGADGSTVIYGYQGTECVILGWFNRNGESIANDIPPFFQQYICPPIYCSNSELIFPATIYGGASTTYCYELFQLDSAGELEHTQISTLHYDCGGNMVVNYPFLFETSQDGSSRTYNFWDLTSSRSLAIVGDAVIGVYGKNLKIRWKTIANAKYQVQVSQDGVAWNDYSEILDGTGSTLVVSIPIDEQTVETYARVVKL